MTRSLRFAVGRADSCSRPRVVLSLLCFFGLATARPSNAHADREHAPSPPSASSSLKEADKHFRRGVELYEDSELAGAQAEFTRAYALYPNYKILYNLGQVAYQRQDYVQALEYFQHYLLDGGPALARDRRLKVDRDIERLERRIGRIAILTEGADDGSEILLDDVKVAIAPAIESIPANVGQRKLEIVRVDGGRVVRRVEVTGGEVARVRFARTVPLLVRAGSTVDALDDPAAYGTTKIKVLSPSLLAPSLLSPSLLAPSLLAPREGSPRPLEGSRAMVWTSWAATTALAAGAATVGGLALGASRDLQRTRDEFPTNPGDLDSSATRTRRLALTADGLLAGALIMTAVSLYLTFQAPAVDSQKASSSATATSRRPTTQATTASVGPSAHWVSQ